MITRNAGAVREMNVRSINIPVGRIRTVGILTGSQNPDLLERVIGIFTQLIDVRRIWCFDVLKFIRRVHPRQHILCFHTV